MLKRAFDLLASIAGLLLVSPLFLLIAVCIALDSKGGVFFRQTRVGKGNRDFGLLKFRTMRTGSERQGLLTIGAADKRVTRVGAVLRKFKLDELPQLINVLKGEMSIVGPRPEVRKYVDLYSPEQREVLSVKPGITDYASIMYMDENQLLGNAESPEKYYCEVIMPHKLSINLEYIHNPSFFRDIKIIFRTLALIAGKVFK